MGERFDAVVVGSGPNGLVAAVTLARSGWKVLVLEAGERPGGGTRTEELTLPGFAHDICSAIHPLGIASPAFRELDLESAGVRWIQPDAPLAHALRPEHAVMLERSVDRTTAGLGADASAWTQLLGPSVRAGLALSDSLLSPLDVPPRHPLDVARFATRGIRSAASLAGRFPGEQGPALLAGLAAHSVLDLDAPITGGFGLLLGSLAHLVGWPIAEAGSQSISDALVRLVDSAGGEVRCGERVRSIEDLPPSRAILCDVAPRQLDTLAGHRLPSRYRRALRRFRHGPGVFKLDWALDGPVPWADPQIARAGTVHLGGTFDEVRRAEHQVATGGHPEEPFVLLGQQSSFDPTRAPGDAQTLWGYCHVPNGSDMDMTERVERRIERFAPGFRDRILARHATSTRQLAAQNSNYVGGDITGGMADLAQFLIRPVPSLRPWATPARGLYLCSASTPPGGGVHGMCGLAAARTVLSDVARGRL